MRDEWIIKWLRTENSSLSYILSLSKIIYLFPGEILHLSLFTRSQQRTSPERQTLGKYPGRTSHINVEQLMNTLSNTVQ